MIGPVGRIGDAFRVGPRAAEVIAVALVVAVTLVAMVATGLNVLPLAIILTLALFAVVVSFRWPLVDAGAVRGVHPDRGGPAPRRRRHDQPARRDRVRGHVWDPAPRAT